MSGVKKKRFGIDIDGTVTCPSSLVPFINESFSLDITLQDIKEYDLAAALNLAPDKVRDWFDQTEPAIYAASPPAQGADSVLAKWQKTFHLLFISARRQHLFDVTKQWFHDQQIYYDHIELVGSHDKIASAKRHEVDIFFEDKHDNAVMIAEELGIPVVLFNTPYNQDPVPDHVIRVESWHEADLWVEQWLRLGQIRPLLRT